MSQTDSVARHSTEDSIKHHQTTKYVEKLLNLVYGKISIWDSDMAYWHWRGFHSMFSFLQYFWQINDK